MINKIKSSLTLGLSMIFIVGGIFFFRLAIFWGFYLLIKWLYLLPANNCERKLLAQILSLTMLVFGPSVFCFFLVVATRLQASIYTFVIIVASLTWFLFFDLDKEKLSKEWEEDEPYYDYELY